MNTKQLTYPTIESQKQFWIDKESVPDNATHETRGDWGIEGTCVDIHGTKVDWQALAISRYERMTALWHENDKLKAALKPFAIAFTESFPVGSIPDENIWIWKPSDNRRETHGISREHLKTADCLLSQLSTTADPKPKDIGGNELPDRIEANEDWYEGNDFDRGDLRDEGRNPDGSGLSYGERNA